MSKNGSLKQSDTNSTPQNWNLLDAIRHSKSHAPTESPIEAMFRERYPDVSEHYRQSWHRSDEVAQNNDDRTTATNNLIALMEQAISACRQLQEQTVPMTPNLLSSYKLPLSKIIHSAQELLDTLDGDYPIPGSNAYTQMIACKELSEIAPKVLRNTDEQIVIWTNALPSKYTKAANLYLEEIRYFLYSQDFPTFTDWHCDFIHVHPTTSLKGVRDVDNYPYKPVIDALAFALHARDSYDHFSYAAYNHPCDSIPSGCYICITKRAQKVGFFRDFENLIKALESVN